MIFQTKQELIDSVRASTSIPAPTTTSCSPSSGLSDDFFLTQAQFVMQGELSRFFPLFSVARLGDPSTGSSVYDLSGLNPQVREVLGVFDNQEYRIPDLGRDPLNYPFLNYWHGHPFEAVETLALWKISQLEVRLLKRMAQVQKFRFIYDTKTLYLLGSNGDNPAILYRSERPFTDSSIASLPTDAQDALEMGTRSRVLERWAGFLSSDAAGGFNRSGGSVEFDAGRSYLRMAESLRRQYEDKLRVLEIRTTMHPLTMGS